MALSIMYQYNRWKTNLHNRPAENEYSLQSISPLKSVKCRACVQRAIIEIHHQCYDSAFQLARAYKYYNYYIIDIIAHSCGAARQITKCIVARLPKLSTARISASWPAATHTGPADTTSLTPEQSCNDIKWHISITVKQRKS